MTIGIPDGWLADPDEAAATVRAAGGEPRRGPLEAFVTDPPRWILLEGDAAVAAAIEAGLTEGLVPLGASPGLEPVDRPDLAAAVASLLDGAGARVSRHGLTASTDEASASAIFDVMLITAAPASISEFAIRAGGRPVDQYRADGIVAASATGSGGYARAAGGPLLDPELPGVSVVPISPFRTADDHWVFDDRGCTIRVARDEGEVTLFADDEEAARLPPNASVAIEGGGGYETVRLPQSRSPFDVGTP